MLVGIASSFNSSSSSSSSSCGMNSDGASTRKSEEDRALMDALNPIFEEIIKRQRRSNQNSWHSVRARLRRLYSREITCIGLKGTIIYSKTLELI